MGYRNGTFRWKGSIHLLYINSNVYWKGYTTWRLIKKIWYINLQSFHGISTGLSVLLKNCIIEIKLTIPHIYKISYRYNNLLCCFPHKPQYQWDMQYYLPIILRDRIFTLTNKLMPNFVISSGFGRNIPPNK